MFCLQNKILSFRLTIRSALMLFMCLILQHSGKLELPDSLTDLDCRSVYALVWFHFLFCVLTSHLFMFSHWSAFLWTAPIISPSISISFAYPRRLLPWIYRTILSTRIWRRCPSSGSNLIISCLVAEVSSFYVVPILQRLGIAHGAWFVQEFFWIGNWVCWGVGFC